MQERRVNEREAEKSFGETTTSGPDEISTGPLFPHPQSFDGSIRPVSYSYEMQVRL